MASYVEFMGYTQPWYSVRDADEPVGGEMGHVRSFLRDGDRVFLTYTTTGRGTEAASGSFAPAVGRHVQQGEGPACSRSVPRPVVV